MNEHTALNLSAVWCAVVNIAGATASLPLKLYRRLEDGGKEPFVDHKIYRLLHDDPNPEMSAFVFRETLTAHVLLWGNCYAEIVRNGAAVPTQLWPLPPSRVEPYRDDITRRIRYRVTGDDGRQVTIAAENILHIPGLGFDGLMGYSVVRKARDTIGLGLATEGFGARFFRDGLRAAGVLEHPGRLSDSARQHLRASVKDQLTEEGSARTLILEEGMKWHQVSIPPEDSQFLETRKFSVSEIARWFNIPPHKLKDLEHATFSNIEHLAIEYVTDTLRPWLVRLEGELRRKLLTPAEQETHLIEHVIEGLLRGDIGTRYAAYAVGRQWGWLSTDDIRFLENMNPLPNGAGKMYLVPLNMVPADRIPEPSPTAPGPDRTSTVLAARGLLEDALRKTLTRQGDRAARNAATPARLRSFVFQFFTDAEAEHNVAAIRQAVALLVDPTEAATVARQIVDEMNRQSRQELETLSKACAVDGLLKGQVEELAKRWALHRPARIADAIAAAAEGGSNG